MAAAAKSLQLQSCLILCYPIDGGPTGSPAPGILHARTLEWVTSPPPGDLPNQGTEPVSPALQVDSLLLEPPLKLTMQETWVQFLG